MQSYMYVRPSFLHLGDIQLEARWEYNFDAADEPRFHYYAVSYLECWHVAIDHTSKTQLWGGGLVNWGCTVEATLGFQTHAYCTQWQKGPDSRKPMQ